jgi:dolichol-phosphate mannosyltransferase
MATRSEAPSAQTSMRPLTVVVPVYNEGSNLRAWYEQARPYLPVDVRIRLVYDFEADDTLPVAKALAAEGAPIELLRNPRRGVLGALLTGLRSVEDGPVLVSMADLSDDFSVLPALLAAHASGAKIAVPSRYMPGGSQQGGPLLKGLLSRFGSLSLHWLAGFPVHDATNSFRLYDANFVQSLALQSEGGFELGFEITLRAWKAGELIVEVPCVWKDRVHGDSHFQLLRWLPHYAALWFDGFRYGMRTRALRLGRDCGPVRR